MKVTAIKAQVKNSDRVSVFVDGKYSVSLTLDQLLTEKLKQGVEIDEARLKILKRLSDEGKLKARALAWLTARPHSTQEFRDYLIKKKADPDLITGWTEDFTAKHYLDDTAFAQWWVDQRARKGRSNRFIQSELYQKGVAREVITDVLGDTASEDDRLLQLISKKKHLARYKSNPDKFMRYLIGQGFSYQSVKDALGGTPEGDG